MELVLQEESVEKPKIQNTERKDRSAFHLWTVWRSIRMTKRLGGLYWLYVMTMLMGMMMLVSTLVFSLL